ncbi:MAG: hypothetical protein HYR88_13455, partial [Verrucomicrobia bacterium]|nr:hypothetical protein [Verrucomicrobiota bacterium]
MPTWDQFSLEPLEQRQMLSGDPLAVSTATSPAHPLTIEQVNHQSSDALTGDSLAPSAGADIFGGITLADIMGPEPLPGAPTPSPALESDAALSGASHPGSVASDDQQSKLTAASPIAAPPNASTLDATAAAAAVSAPSNAEQMVDTLTAPNGPPQATSLPPPSLASPSVDKALSSVDRMASILLPFLSAGQVSGLTIITHGFQLLASGGDSLMDLARAIQKRTNGWLLDYDITGDTPRPGFDPDQSVLPSSDNTQPHEAVLLFDWADASNNLSSGWGDAAGDALFNLITQLGFVDPNKGEANTLPLHFIAHSFGSVVTSEAVERLARFDVPVDQVTYLDPHDFNQGLVFDGAQQLFTLGAPEGYGASVWSNVSFTDVYYETRGANGSLVPDAVVPRGRPIVGAYDLLLAGGNQLPGNASDGAGAYDTLNTSGDHSYVWDSFYMAPVTGGAISSQGTRLLNLGVDLDGDGHQDTRPAPAQDVDFSATGFALSHAAGGESRRHLPQFAPNFFSASQDHRYTSSLLWDPAAQTPNAKTLLDWNLTASQLENIQWAPRWNPLVITNGDFDGGVSPFGSARPGWAYNGGNPAGIVQPSALGIGNGTNYLFLDSESGSADHNPVFISQGAGILSMDLENASPLSPKGKLEVLLVDAQGEVSLGKIQLPLTGKTTAKLPIPDRFLGEVAQIRMRVSADSSFKAGVGIDNVRFESAFVGRTGDVFEIDLSQATSADHFELPDFGPDFLSLSSEKPDRRGDHSLIRSIGGKDYSYGKIILSDRWGEPYSETGHFLFAPSSANDSLPGDLASGEGNGGYQGTFHLQVSYTPSRTGFALGSSIGVTLVVNAGATGTGPNAVVSGSGIVAVARAQQRLNWLGMRDLNQQVLDVDAILGDLTASSLQRFQTAEHLDQTAVSGGGIDAPTAARLNAPIYTAKGSSDALRPGEIQLLTQAPTLFDRIAAALGQIPQLSAALPLVGIFQDLNALQGEAKALISLASGLDFSKLFGSLLSDPLNAFLSSSTAASSVADLVASLNHNPSLIFSSPKATADELSLTGSLNIDKSVDRQLELGSSLRDSGFNLGDAADGAAPGGVTVALKLHFEAQLTVGIDRSKLSDPANALFIRLGNIKATASVDTSALTFQASLGILRVLVKNGTVKLSAAVAIGMVDSDPLGITADGRLTLGELSRVNPLSLFTVSSATGSLAARFPFELALGKFKTTGSPQFSFSLAAGSDNSSGFFNPQPLQYSLSGLEDAFGAQGIGGFLSMKPSDLLSGLGQAFDGLGLVPSDSVFSEALHFLPGATWKKITTAGGATVSPMDIAKALKDQVLNVLTKSDGSPLFKTIQDVIERIQKIVTIDLTLDKDRGPILTLDFNIHENLPDFATSIDFGFGLGDLADFSTQSQFTITPSVDLSFRLGIVMTPIGNGFALKPGTRVVNVTQKDSTVLKSEINGERAIQLNTDANQPDLLITVRNALVGDRGVFRVNLSKVQTIEDVESAIISQTFANGQGQVAAFRRGDRLVLQDLSLFGGKAGTQVFRVSLAPGSFAGLPGIGLGIAGSDDDGDGVIEGSPLHGDSIGNHVFLQNATLVGRLALNATDLNASARLGFLGLSINKGTGAAEAIVTVHLSDPGVGPQHDGRIFLNELLDSFDLERWIASSGPIPDNGILSGIATIRIGLGLDPPVTIRVSPPAASDTRPRTAEDLITDLNDAISQTSLAGVVKARANGNGVRFEVCL